MKAVKIISILALVCAVCLASIHTGIRKKQTVFGKSIEENRPVIIVDAGHGGFDGGAVADDGTVEKDINLDIALCLKSMLELSGFETVLTRDTDTSTDDITSDVIAKRKKKRSGKSPEADETVSGQHFCKHPPEQIHHLRRLRGAGVLFPKL